MRLHGFTRLKLWKGALVWQVRHRWERTPIGVRFAITLLGVVGVVLTPLVCLNIYSLQQATQAQYHLNQARITRRVAQILEREMLEHLHQAEICTMSGDGLPARLGGDPEQLLRRVVYPLIRCSDSDAAAVVDLRGRVLASSSDEARWLCAAPTVQRAMRGVGGAEWIRHRECVYLVSAIPLYDTAQQRQPVGVLAAARRLDDAYLSRIGHLLGGRVAIAIHSSPTQTSAVDASTDSATLRGSDGTPLATIRWIEGVSEPRGATATLYRVKKYLIGSAALVALTSSLAMVFFLRRHLAGFLAALHRLAAGNWNTRVAYTAPDEFGYLARAFNTMAYQLQQAFAEQERQRKQIQAQNEELHALYQQLQATNMELAQLNRDLTEANRALAQAAVTDGLTGLKNHRAFQEALHSLVQMAERLQQPLSLIMLDIDYFKQFNDTFGHPAGDDLLRQVAQVLRDSARAYDVAARYGGEEFALLLPNTTLEQAVQVAERLREAIGAIANPHRAITASLGVATYRGGAAPATLLYEADAALYRAKRDGRNRVCTYHPEAA